MNAMNWHSTTEQSLAVRARDILSNSKIPAIRAIIVEQNSAGVILRGQVKLYYYKQLAQELIRNELDDIAILNQIEVTESN